MGNSNLEAYLNRYEYTQAFKEKIVLKVVNQGKPVQKAVEEYGSAKYLHSADVAYRRQNRPVQ